MNATTVLALLDFFGWKKAIVLTEPHTQIEVSELNCTATFTHSSLSLNLFDSVYTQVNLVILIEIRIKLLQIESGSHTNCFSFDRGTSVNRAYDD